MKPTYSWVLTQSLTLLNINNSSHVTVEGYPEIKTMLRACEYTITLSRLMICFCAVLLS